MSAARAFELLDICQTIDTEAQALRAKLTPPDQMDGLLDALGLLTGAMRDWIAESAKSVRNPADELERTRTALLNSWGDAYLGLVGVLSPETAMQNVISNARRVLPKGRHGAEPPLPADNESPGGDE